MTGKLRDRVLAEAEHILESGATVRGCAMAFGVGKTTVHKDMRQRLPDIDREKARRVDQVLRRNLLERHIRGGEATREMYLARRGKEAK